QIPAVQHPATNATPLATHANVYPARDLRSASSERLAAPTGWPCQSRRAAVKSRQRRPARRFSPIARVCEKYAGQVATTAPAESNPRLIAPHAMCWQPLLQE